MPQLDYDSTSIYFEEHGSGFPLLLIAPGVSPGAMNSIIESGPMPRSTHWPFTKTPLALVFPSFLVR